MALEWKDKVNGEDWVLAEDINSIAHAVQEIDDKKIDKISDISQTGNFGGAYILKTDGTQGMMKITNTIGSGTLPIRGNGGVIVAGTPNDDSHVATKRYVDKAVATVQGQLDTLGTFYEVVKVYSTDTFFIEIPTGAMPTAYIESAGFTVQNTDGTLVYTGTANGLYFLDEHWMDISFISFTAPAYIQIPENARQIRVNCDELVPDNVGWDAGPLVFSGAVYFQVKRG